MKKKEKLQKNKKNHLDEWVKIISDIKELENVLSELKKEKGDNIDDF